MFSNLKVAKSREENSCWIWQDTSCCLRDEATGGVIQGKAWGQQIIFIHASDIYTNPQNKSTKPYVAVFMVRQASYWKALKSLVISKSLDFYLPGDLFDLFRVWSTWAGWVCLRKCRRAHTNPLHSTTRERCAKHVKSVNMSRKNSFRWGECSLQTSLHWTVRLVKHSRLSPHSSLEVSDEVRQYLKTPTFDNW